MSAAVALAAFAALTVDWALDGGGGGRVSDGVLWAATVGIGIGTAGLFPNGIALGRSMFLLAGVTQAFFELGKA
jgi:hypothetical protein